jgi:histidinol-phosphate aminotransferase
MLIPRDPLLRLPSYHPPLGGREGLRLDFNENVDGCSPRVLERLRQLNPDQLTKYPEREPAEALVAESLKVDRNEVLLTNGVDEAIHLVCETYLDRGDEALIVVPTYAMYEIYAKSTGARLVAVPAEQGFRFPTQTIVDLIGERTRLIAIANPNNPTGTVVSSEELLCIARSAPSAAVLIDEAYFEFYGKTVLDKRREASNVFVTRTFSKVYGLAGLRLGVLVGDAEQMHSVRRVTSPYNVNAVALACLPEALADQSYIQEYVDEVIEGRERLQHFLDANGIQYWPSHANFVLLRVGSSRSDSAKVIDQMRQRGILIRDRSRDAGCEGCVRVTLGRRQHVDRLMLALQCVFEELAIAPGVSRP